MWDTPRTLQEIQEENSSYNFLSKARCEQRMGIISFVTMLASLVAIANDLVLYNGARSMPIDAITAFSLQGTSWQIPHSGMYYHTLHA